MSRTPNSEHQHGNCHEKNGDGRIGQSEFRIREAGRADLSAMAEVYNAARPSELEACGVSEEAFTTLDGTDLDLEFARGMRFLVAEKKNGTLIGVSGFTNRELSLLYIDPRYHRRGVGRALLRAVLVRAGRTVQTSLMIGNIAAEQLYEANGFLPGDEFEGFVNGIKIRYRKMLYERNGILTK